MCEGRAEAEKSLIDFPKRSEQMYAISEAVIEIMTLRLSAFKTRILQLRAYCADDEDIDFMEQTEGPAYRASAQGKCTVERIPICRNPVRSGGIADHCSNVVFRADP
jgi:hypothetical protein